jgi:hypothetical protein
MKGTLETLGVPYKEIKVYGSQVMITAYSRAAALKWQSVLTTFATIQGRGATESIDYTKVNTQTVMNPSTVKVWRVWATIGETAR